MDAIQNAKISAGEFVQSLTGFEEIAIERHMGIDPYADGEAKPMKVMRALVFVQYTRDGVDPSTARQRAMDLTMHEVQERFEDEDPEIDEDSPETPSGEGSAHSG